VTKDGFDMSSNFLSTTADGFAGKLPNRRVTDPQPLPDLVRKGLDALFVGINPGLRSAALGHHFAGTSNRFWKLLHESGLVDRPLTFENDRELPALGLGLTNIVDRPSRSVGDLGPEDFERGRKHLERKIITLAPKLVAFVGVIVYREFYRERGAVECGLSERTIGSSRVFILPNPSGRNAHFSYGEMLAVYRALAREIAKATPRKVTRGRAASTRRSGRGSARGS
jgi:double-stranded uracil-DNA glycosylase